VGLTTPHHKHFSCYEMFQSTSDLDWFFERVQWWAFVNMVMNLQVPYESRIFFDKLSDDQLLK